MENKIITKTNYISYFINGTVYMLYNSYNMFSYIGTYFKKTTDEELVQKGLDNLYAVRKEVTSREQSLRESVKIYFDKASHFAKRNMKREAKVMIKLYMLYDIQVNHCQTTMTAIESHIISLESLSFNRKVCCALKESNYVNGFEHIDENILEDAVEKLDDRNINTSEFLKALGDTPSLEIDDSMIENELLKLESNISENNNPQSLQKTNDLSTDNISMDNTSTISDMLLNLPIVPTSSITTHNSGETRALVGS